MRLRPLALLAGRTFASVRKHRNYRLYFFGQGVSFSGSMMQQIAASWLVLELTHSPVDVGWLALCQLLPVTLLGLASGTVLDRLDPRRTTLATTSLSFVFSGLLAGLTLAGVVTVPEIFALSAVLGTILVFDNPARHALTFQMVGRGDVANAVALNSSLGTASRVLGPGIGGPVVALAGPGAAFALNSASFLAIIGALLAVRVDELVPLDRGERKVPLLEGIREGFSFARRSARAATPILVVFAVSTFAFNFNVLLPVLAKRTLHAGVGVYGLVAAVFGAGALVGALAAATMARASVRLLLVGAAGYGVLELALAPQRSLAAVCALLFAIGVFYIMWGANALTSLQLVAPDRLRGRMIAFYFFAFQGGAPLGGLAAGWLSARGGTRLAFLVGGIVATAAAGTAALVFARTQGVSLGAERRRLRARVGRVRAR